MQNDEVNKEMPKDVETPDALEQPEVAESKDAAPLTNPETAAEVESDIAVEPIPTPDSSSPEKEPVDDSPEPESKEDQPTVFNFKNAIVVPLTSYSPLDDAARKQMDDHLILEDDAAENFSPTQSAAALTQIYSFKVAQETVGESQVGDVLKISANTVTEASPNVIRGEAASRLLSAAKGGTYRLRLPASGFSVLLRKPSLEILNALFESLDITMEEMGKIVGDFRHLFRHVLFYQAVVDYLPTLVTYSNLENYRADGALANNIRYSDMPIIVWALCILSGLRDYSTVYVCPKDGVRTEIDLDILSMTRLRKGFNPEAIEYLSSNEKRSSSDLKKYHEMINLSETVEIDDGEYDLVEPSVARWLEESMRNLSLIRDSVDGAPSVMKRQVFNKASLSMQHGLCPWISRFRIKSIDGKLMHFEGPEAVRQQLDDMVMEPSWDGAYDKFVETVMGFEQYVIGHTPPKCKQCGQVDDSVEFYVWDPSKTFLITTYQKLAMTGVRLTDDPMLDLN